MPRPMRWRWAWSSGGCRALGSLPANHPADQAAITAPGGVGCVVAVMRARANAVGVQEWGYLLALGSLAVNHPAN